MILEMGLYTLADCFRASGVCRDWKKTLQTCVLQPLRMTHPYVVASPFHTEETECAAIASIAYSFQAITALPLRCTHSFHLLPRMRHLRHLSLRGCSELVNSDVLLLQPPPSLTSLDLSDCWQLGPPTLRHVATFHDLLHLNLSYLISLGDAGFTSLALHPNLQRLQLRASGIGDAALHCIARIQTLRHLNLGWCGGITDRGVRALGALAQLGHLSLQGTRVADAGVQALGNLSQLRSLKMTACDRLTDAGVPALAALGNLQRLSLAGCWRIRDLQPLAGLRDMRHLDITATTATDAVLGALVAGMAGLRHLRLEHCPITDSGLVPLATLPALEFLDVTGCRLSSAGVQTVASLRTLQHLRIANCFALGYNGLRTLAHLPRLQELDVTACTMVTADAVHALRESLRGTLHGSLRVRHGHLPDPTSYV
jgi:hypothetical protein